ncbi:alpha-ketoacid dehydrogenase subunit beta [Trichlorobacter ammonificans]|uniref:Pyruvate dehydrogenase complex, dehydrogenase (E1) component, beta subunit n=1 Tax=Trichlorobacter ammonificans TaxID=2916410 RepID=A0ABM9DAS3_9BACT|nr:pyruvate dehydrogenase complex E1 component subunit beta [Trichlorobacter ammonificans]CAH2032332.1 Pyruvate dehydrogenase complex, dehydrogenase (E1) component, beta subunit [Trichlorobacter ammonificans]
MSMPTRLLSYSLAINEAFHQTMELDSSVMLIGQGVKSPWYVGNTAQGLIARFGEARVIDTPVSENAMTGAAVGAALAGMRPVVVHPRMDFMLYAFDPIINEAANWYYMNGGKLPVPVVIWGVVNRGGEQGAQHSQTLHAMFAHVPGLKVVMPATAYDAKGLMVAAIQDNNPVVFIDDRWLYGTQEHVPEELYSVPIGQGVVRRKGKDVTIVSISYMVKEALEAASILASEGIDVEVVDPRTIKPLDSELILNSVKKTGRAVIADGGWKAFGAAAEIAALIAENLVSSLKSNIVRVTLPDVPAPASRTLEQAYYPKASEIVEAVKLALK